MGGTGVRHSRDHYGAPAVLLVRGLREIMCSRDHVLCVCLNVWCMCVCVCVCCVCCVCVVCVVCVCVCVCGVCCVCVCVCGVCVCVSLVKPDSGHYYGFVYFRQAKDADIKRGYFQKVRMM